MIKILGAVFILIATTWIGFEAARHLSERTRQLRQLKVALQSLEAEIMYAHTPLTVAAENLAKQMRKPLSPFFELFASKLKKGHTSVKTAWDESIEEVLHLTAFKHGELEVLKQFGETLGQHDRLSQQKHIKLTLSHLEREEADAVDRQTRYERLVKSLGFLSGLLLIILLM
ncbi:stage III sporulation protein SpoIIIAB [Metabacillus fastidiosus]|uniref:Stage III sporulation protein SpoIIIAB n=1 Tax=Metabacillus fastidiosus TaxID=1458 RepID=A0ABU6NUS6_9BACI|nr:stage III sporulation protein SpoIIIAB [Metabacillus fastidiosus]MEC2075404.1 stage III sporulation protein SpoIIIAB [Metabacillus fastidiosus]MED4400890.1 stage III sporulation protein SpoIIIAB [Metabacillus fastidiosus]MED4453534.1 stage III sporulation protein SpoIIIAB [Metabacillus fastidiosus]MED4463816.1 stage III sporulation protein SpoIIIAB [Metabacillus fastidiosus]MED4530672.1 stage III sporulation protein SpoIIIAB [Metabacillus fastidiosus]